MRGGYKQKSGTLCRTRGGCPLRRGSDFHKRQADILGRGADSGAYRGSNASGGDLLPGKKSRIIRVQGGYMKRIWFFIITGLLAFCAAGSRGTVSSLDRAMVSAVGIDTSDKGYKVTLQIFRPDSAGTDTQLDPAKANIFVVSETAATVEEAMVVQALNTSSNPSSTMAW